MSQKLKNNKTQKLGIDHNLNEFKEGQEYIMTLQDQSVLDDFADPTGQTDIDVLENTDLQVDFNRGVTQNQKIQKTQFDIKNRHQQSYQGLNNVDKYDDIEAKMKEQRGKVILQDGETKQISKNKQQEEEILSGFKKVQMRKKVKKTAVLDDFEENVFGTQFQKDYYQPKVSKNEKANFKTILNKRRKMVDPAEKFQNEPNSDLVADVKKDEISSNKKQEKYSKAIFKRKQKILQVKQTFDLTDADQTINNILHQGDSLFLDEQYVDQADQSIKFRKQKNKKAQVQDFLSLYDKKEEEATGQEFDQNLNSIVISGIQNISNDQEKTVKEGDCGYKSVVNMVLPSQRVQMRSQGEIEIKKLPQVPDFDGKIQIEEKTETSMRNEESAEKKEIPKEEQKVFGNSDVDIIVGKGVKNAMTYFQTRGMLGSYYEVVDGQSVVEGTKMAQQEALTEVVKGRNNDQTLAKQLQLHGASSNQEGDRVKLQYRDKQGNQQTLKQAFRDLCHKFHGHRPSHRQQEKQNRQVDKQNAIFKQNKTENGQKIDDLPQLKNMGRLIKKRKIETQK